MRLRRSSGLVLGLLLLLAGCGQPAVTRGAGPASSTGLAAPATTPATGELSAAKKKAAIEDCPASDPSVPAHQQGLPDLVLQCLGGGRPVRLAGLRGRPMMINIWAQWCPPCRQEAPFISEVAQQKQDRLLVLGVDYADPRPELAIEFAQLSGWRFPQLVDQDHALKDPLKIIGPPQTLFVDAQGVVVYRHSGPFSSAEQIRELAQTHLGVTL
ncbi:hypothetical protein GCM10009841_01200 [Microlunatus panaciterrae]|uniref:Thiol-disulfide isomerase/thioredoxin n=1 Tax=Microlunatus panaciterrae TaxID=400768 RepID=A0ABS2RJQ0_9ACTN|nr:TlpA disulfide reductase family protein [Microlunatus panaciterrae]MBM7799202.1 thiol-disulfide isomerase/thioredoxin [Microlunatus panaciterrae]